VIEPTELPVAILAGGLATRLGPITARVPKLLVEVAGEPFFTHQLRLLKRSGLRHVVVCTGHLGDMIVERFGDGAAWDMKIEYSHDGPTLLGTGGALIRALPLLGPTFYVLYGDSYLPIDYPAVGRAFFASGRAGLMTVYENQGRFDTSNIWFADDRIMIYDKKTRLPQMHHIDYGLGVLHQRALDPWPREQPVDLASVYAKLVSDGEMAGYEVKQRFYEIGSPAGLAELDDLLRSRPPDSAIFD
jgi:N-acetyl-alpha-D-muramate 1-phosphate uridylyltransferase